MMRSLFSGVAGLRNHQVRMDVIGNNIANVNTVGFKKSRVSFQDMLSQNIRGAASPQGNRGGTNPMQVGLGMTVSAIETVHSPASVRSTGKNTDLAIAGDGFFIVADGLRNYYTRDGSFTLDRESNLVSSNGMKVMGFLADDNAYIDPEKTSLQPLVLSNKMSIPGKKTTSASFTGNLDSRATKGEEVTKDISVYDSQGRARVLTLKFKKLEDPNKPGGNSWKFTVAISGAQGGMSGTLTFNSDGSLTKAAKTNANINEDGALVMSGTSVTTNRYNIKYSGASFAAIGGFSFSGANVTGLSGATLNESKALPFPLVDLVRLTQYASPNTVSAYDQDGYSMGDLQSVGFDATGTLTGAYSNGQKRKLAQVATAIFSNPMGLNKVAENLYEGSNNSGEAIKGLPGTYGRGTIIPGSLEMSNVDLSQEFTDMITTQRGFQANSRIITVSDTMLEELINLKR